MVKNSNNPKSFKQKKEIHRRRLEENRKFRLKENYRLRLKEIHIRRLEKIRSLQLRLIKRSNNDLTFVPPIGLPAVWDIYEEDIDNYKGLPKDCDISNPIGLAEACDINDNTKTDFDSFILISQASGLPKDCDISNPIGLPEACDINNTYYDSFKLNLNLFKNGLY